jgi:putative acetyltransferase
MSRIRLATPLDRHGIGTVHRAAFPESERETIAGLALALLEWESTPPTLSLVAEAGGAVIGHVAFSPVSLDQREDWSGYILAPLAVTPAHQGKGLGTALVESGIRQLAGADVLFVYGDPDYYGRFGFDAATTATYQPPHVLEYPFGWQALKLGSRRQAAAQGALRCVEPLDDPALW